MRKTKQDWLEAGFQILAEAGVAALTIEKLTGALNVTKGSFYHHFKGFGDYKQALLAHFETEGTLRVIEQTDQRESAAARLRFLFDLIVAYAPQLEIAIRSWALHDAEVRAVQSRIDAARIDYVRALCAELAPDPDQALLMGQMAYAILIGSGHIQPPLSAAVLRQLFDEFLRLYRI